MHTDDIETEFELQQTSKSLIMVKILLTSFELEMDYNSCNCIIRVDA